MHFGILIVKYANKGGFHTVMNSKQQSKQFKNIILFQISVEWGTVRQTKANSFGIPTKRNKISFTSPLVSASENAFVAICCRSLYLQLSPNILVAPMNELL